MTVRIADVLQKNCIFFKKALNFLKVAAAIFLSFSKVDFYVIVQKENGRADYSAFLQKIEKTKFPMIDVAVFIVGFLGFVRNNKNSTRKLNE